MAVTVPVALPLRIGARTLGHIRRRLIRFSLNLEQARRGELPRLPHLPSDSDGYLLRSIPAHLLAPLVERHPHLRPFVRQRYHRSYASLETSFNEYLASFSSKTRATLKRKVRKFADRSGGRLDLRRYCSAAEVDDFYRNARAVSARTYQERLLDAGLPQGEQALAQMHELARQDAMRGWVLFLDGAPISYLYAPAEGRTLIYAYLGYDPDFADLSPGTVLQFEAMRQLMDEDDFTFFDFTEGEGQHKRLFGTGSIDCLDLLLVRRSLSNLAAGHLLNGFDSSLALAKRGAAVLNLDRLARTLIR